MKQVAYWIAPYRRSYSSSGMCMYHSIVRKYKDGGYILKMYMQDGNDIIPQVLGITDPFEHYVTDKKFFDGVIDVNITQEFEDELIKHAL